MAAEQAELLSMAQVLSMIREAKRVKMWFGFARGVGYYLDKTPIEAADIVCRVRPDSPGKHFNAWWEFGGLWIEYVTD